MAFERLALEVGAGTAGFSMVKPPVIKGRTGIEHTFSALIKDGSRVLAFDTYESVTEIEVLRSYAKQFDTGASTRIVCLGEAPTERARSLAAEYSMEILNQEGLSKFLGLQRVVQLGS